VKILISKKEWNEGKFMSCVRFGEKFELFEKTDTSNKFEAREREGGLPF
jgi:hypothetical protein